jgi:outer membrane protein assembly factor BamB
MSRRGLLAAALVLAAAAAALPSFAAPGAQAGAQAGASVGATGAEGSEAGLRSIEPAFRLAAGGRALAGPVADGAEPAAAWLVSEDLSLYALTESGGLASRSPLGGRPGGFLAVDPFGRALVTVDGTTLLAVARSGIEAYRAPIEAVPGYAAAFAPAFGSDGRAFVLSGRGVLCLNPAGRRLWELPLPEDVSCAPAVDGSGRAAFGLSDGTVLLVSPYGEILARFQTGAPPVLLAPMSAPSRAGPAPAAVAAAGSPLPSLAAGLADGRILFFAGEGRALAQAKVGTAPRELAWDGKVLYGLDAGGSAFALSASGSLLWSTPTACQGGRLELFGERLVACGRGRAVSLSLSGEVYRELSVPDAVGLVAVTPGGLAFSSGTDWILAAYRFERPLGEAGRAAIAAYPALPDVAAEDLLYDAFAADADHQRDRLAAMRERLESGTVGRDEPRMAAYCAAVASDELSRELPPLERKRRSNPLPRAEAVYLLGDLGSPDYRGFLIRALEADPEPAVRSAACEALAAVGVDPDGATASAFYDAAARPIDERTALVLAEVIGGTAFRFGTKPSLDAVRALLKLADKPYLPAVRSRAAAALSRLADTLR